MVPDATPHKKLSLTHHRNGELATFSLIPPHSGRRLIHVADLGDSSETFADEVSGMFLLDQD